MNIKKTNALFNLYKQNLKKQEKTHFSVDIGKNRLKVGNFITLTLTKLEGKKRIHSLYGQLLSIKTQENFIESFKLKLNIGGVFVIYNVPSKLITKLTIQKSTISQ